MEVVVDQIVTHTDGRGAVFEPLGPEALGGQRNVHVVITEPGAIRGNHRHRRGMETIVVYGPALVRLREGARITEREVTEGPAIRFTIPPGVSHAIKNTGDSPNLLVCFNTAVHDPQDTDTDILIEA